MRILPFTFLGTLNETKQAHSQFLFTNQPPLLQSVPESETPFINPMSKVSRPVWTKESP